MLKIHRQRVAQDTGMINFEFLAKTFSIINYNNFF